MELWKIKSEKEQDKIKNKSIWEHLGLKSIGVNLCLRWFGHVQHKPTMVPVS